MTEQGHVVKKVSHFENKVIMSQDESGNFENKVISLVKML